MLKTPVHGCRVGVPFLAHSPVPIAPMVRLTLSSLVLLSLVARAVAGQQPFPRVADAPERKPAPAPPRWRGLLGEYGRDSTVACTLESGGTLLLLEHWKDTLRLRALGADRFAVTSGGDTATRVAFRRGRDGLAVEMRIGDTTEPRREVGPRPGTNQLRITPLRPIPELRREALAARPPRESGEFETPDLVELRKLDPTIRLEIRYATTNNFLGSRLYEQARAFMQRPAAEALVRANRALKSLGYGLLVHDAYRPWYVTKIFWDATPDDKKWLVADPAHGSVHNRGAAVDLTLYELKTGRPVEMPSTYDESTDRAFAIYPCGTSLQRWHRALLRGVMEAQGFTVNPTEWWHFDFRDARRYPIENVPFARIGASR